MKTKEEIQQMLDETVNTLLGQHRGRVEITDVLDENGGRVATMTFSGGCRGCAGAKATMRSIVLNHINNFDPTITAVVDVTDHTDKSNAFFK